MSERPDVLQVRQYFMELQESICTALAAEDGEQDFSFEELPGPGGGLARPRVLADGPVIEKAAVQFTHSVGSQLPAAATERNPGLAGRGFQATAISLIVHPRNPYAPTTHMNLRFFIVDAKENEQPFWYFGGGFDLTPYYGFEDDAIHWHSQARAACEPFGADLYPRLKEWCDRYFYLDHRDEQRGIGGVFFDDWTENGYEQSFAFTRSVGEHFLPAYIPILARRKTQDYGDRERDFQLYRRGRYAEFNLAIDRGTRYGMQSGRRIESVLASLPPLAAWKYAWKAEPGSPEAALTDYYLKPRDWLAETSVAASSGS
ncbi:MAG: oxygen-dependent coproporphyrinogen oxidase [Gammaproteobacteria bacterium]|nr:MAG: oxygen-dependent coproporphyrinogen oxidase [Gammaproteobacteria bacterium]